MNSTVPLCVTGCGAVGTKYTTDPKLTACDAHASKGARDLPYADIVRASVAAENKACAKVADDMRRGGNPEGAADAVRARGGAR